jgi:UDP-N-acetylmuramoylalanine-D-glutamate ligase
MTDLAVLSGLRILVVGLGREGVALAEYLTRAWAYGNRDRPQTGRHTGR